MAVPNSARYDTYSVDGSWLGNGCGFYSLSTSSAFAFSVIALSAPLFGDRETGELIAGVLLAVLLLILPATGDWLVALLACGWLIISEVPSRYDWCGLSAGVLLTNAPLPLQALSVVIVAATVTTRSDMDAVLAASYTLASVVAVTALAAIVLVSRRERRPQSPRLQSPDADPELGRRIDSPSTSLLMM